MHQPQEIQGRREAKYALPSESLASAIRELVAPFLHPDPHAVGLPGNRYRLVSLYLDTPALDTYLDVVHGERNRYKLRIRRYPDSDSPAFFEVKSKLDDIIRKRRAAVRPEAVPELLAGAPPRLSHLARPDSSQLADLLRFRDLLQMGEMAPRIRVAYRREPWVDRPGGKLRITFDRRVVCSPTPTADVLGRDAIWLPACSTPVVLEIKFNDTMPEWLVGMIHRFNLVRGSVPKYVLSIDACRRQGIPVAGDPAATLR